MTRRFDFDFLVNEDEVENRSMELQSRIQHVIWEFIEELHPSGDVDGETMTAAALALDYCNASQWADICMRQGWPEDVAQELSEHLTLFVFDRSHEAMKRITDWFTRESN